MTGRAESRVWLTPLLVQHMLQSLILSPMCLADCGETWTEVMGVSRKGRTAGHPIVPAFLAIFPADLIRKVGKSG